MSKNKKQKSVFASTKFTAESLQDVLWDTLQSVKKRKVEAFEANTIIMAAKEICSIARLEMQMRILEGAGLPEAEKQTPIVLRGGEK